MQISAAKASKGFCPDRVSPAGSIGPTLARQRALATDPLAGGRPVAQSERKFRQVLEHGKLLAAIVLPLRAESTLVRRYAADLQGWKRTVASQSSQALQRLALGMLGVAVALAVVFAAAILWRIAAVRYVRDASRRRVVLIARNVVVVAAIALVLVFHFTSELAALVTALGFAAAGVAFALQNVILAFAGYFSIVAPNGIRVGDRVSLQGPFGYVHGEVAEIGLVRIRLRELAGDPLRPTGRVVVFPNSVVFTGSFFKHPATEEAS